MTNITIYTFPVTLDFKGIELSSPREPACRLTFPATSYIQDDIKGQTKKTEKDTRTLNYTQSSDALARITRARVQSPAGLACVPSVLSTGAEGAMQLRVIMAVGGWNHSAIMAMSPAAALANTRQE